MHSSLPINHIVFFGRIPVVLGNRRSSQGGGGGAHPLDPPPRSASAVETHTKSRFLLLRKFYVGMGMNEEMKSSSMFLLRAI